MKHTTSPSPLAYYHRLVDPTSPGRTADCSELCQGHPAGPIACSEGGSIRAHMQEDMVSLDHDDSYGSTADLKMNQSVAASAPGAVRLQRLGLQDGQVS